MTELEMLDLTLSNQVCLGFLIMGCAAFLGVLTKGPVWENTPPSRLTWFLIGLFSAGLGLLALSTVEWLCYHVNLSCIIR